MAKNKKEVIILIHGVWMKGPEFFYLQYMLWRQGYKVYQFHYSSLFKTPEENAVKLYQFISKIDAPAIHFVAHSLGGIIIKHLFDNQEIKQTGKVVMIGSPINGSAIAAFIYNKKHLKHLLGKSIINGLLGDAPSWNYKRKICVIAGTKSLGIGQLLARDVLQEKNDGTVNLSETYLENADEYYEVARNHFLLLFSNDVLKIILRFLKK